LKLRALMVAKFSSDIRQPCDRI